MNLVALAQRIRSLRKERGLTIDQVVARTDLTRSWLSKVENFRVTPSLPALAKIASALGVSVAELVEGLDRPARLGVVRRGERRVVERDRPSSETTYEALAELERGGAMDPFMLTVPAGAARRRAMVHEGEEFLIVLEGAVELEYGEETVLLGTGDAAYFDATVQHRLRNRSRAEVKVLCVFAAAAGERRGPSVRVQSDT